MKAVMSNSSNTTSIEPQPAQSPAPLDGLSDIAITKSAEPKTAQRLNHIDGLRGIAISMVLVRHFYMDSYGPGIPRWADICGLGYLGVHLFLLLSGFCVTWAYVGPRARALDLREFARRRATRILPAYYVALVLFTILALPMPGGVLLWQMATHITMTHNLFPSTTLAINGVFWSLALECQLYLLFPLLFLNLRRRGIVPVLLTVFAVQLTYRLIVAHYFGTQWNETMTVAWAVVGRMGEFALGIYAALLVGRSPEQPGSDTLHKMLPFLFFILWGAGMLCKQKLGVSAPFTDLAFTGSFFCLLLWACRTDSLAHRLLSWRPLVALGVISYSVYLIHILPMTLFAHALRSHIQPFPMLVLGLGPACAFAILCGYLYFRLVERPSLDYFARKRKASL